MQGLAFARGLTIVPSPRSRRSRGRRSAACRRLARSRAWVDAQRGEVFAALYDGSPLDELAAPTAASPEADACARARGARRLRHRCVFVGDGAVRYRDAIARSARRPRGRPGVGAPPLAAEAGRIAAVHPERAVAPARRRPALRATARRRAGARARTDASSRPGRRHDRLRATNDIVIERLTRDADLDAGRQRWKRASFTNPWTPRRCWRGSCGIATSTRVFLLRLPDAAGRRLLLVLARRRRAPHQHAGRRLSDSGGRDSGALLMRHVLADAAAIGRPARDARGPGSNVAARRLYERLGFTVTGDAAELLHAARGGRADSVARRSDEPSDASDRLEGAGVLCYLAAMNVPRVVRNLLQRRRRCRQTSKS